MDHELLKQAKSMGIEAAFEDAEGTRRRADETTVRLLLELLSQPHDDAPAIVAHDGDTIDVGFLANGSTPARAALCKNDHVLARSMLPGMELPDDLPRGAYSLDVTMKNGEHKILPLLLAPTRAYQPQFALDGDKSWVLNVQLYSLASARNFGHGDFTDLLHLLEKVADVGGGGVGVNPLHALAEDKPDEASPYAPSSRLFLNWLYIDVGDLPGLTPQEIESVRPATKDDGLVDYVGIAAAKETLLRLSHERFDANDEAFAAFRATMGEDLRRYAAFCLLRRREGGSWRYWRRPWAQPTPDDIAALMQYEADEIGFHEFVQFQAHRQLARCSALAEERQMAIGLYLDVAVGVHLDGFDVWNDPAAFLEGATIGAPPDALNRAGQNWGLTGFHPVTLRQRGYAPFRQMLAASMRHAGAIRLDHVLGLNRIYVIPPGAQATAGAYIKFPLEELLAVAALESQRHRCLIIGEDLGTVPDGLREHLRAHGIWTYRVALFERDEQGFRKPQDYPAAALATFSTHDLPTFAGWLAGEDIKLAATLGLPPPETAQARKETLAALSSTLGEPVTYESMVKYLNDSESRLVSFALEDLLGSTTQVNMPGTYREYPNWRHRLPFDIAAVARKLPRLARK